MKITKVLLFFLLINFSLQINAQPYQVYHNIPVTDNGRLLKSPWAGGFDSPIIQPIDLNGDGIKDLFVFEKGGASEIHFRYYTFINRGTANAVDYVYAPEYIQAFPADMRDWVLLTDYDCDGREDVFTYSLAAGMTVYHNDFSGGLSFHKTYDPVRTNSSGTDTTLFVSTVNQPALVDVDNDGDLDVLTFKQVGFSVEYHQNLAVENFGRCDTLVYNFATSCWGNFSLNSNRNTAVLNISCREGSFTLPITEEERTNRHSGSCAMAADMDGDGDVEFINGDILGNNLLYIENGGTAAAANMVSQDSAFPVYNLPVDFRSFPAAYYFDADNDGNKDLLVTGCAPGSSRNFNNVLFYKNTTNNTTNVFNYVRNNVLVDEMIDVGSAANVSLTDVDGDGLQDMVIGNYKYTYQEPPDTSTLTYYRNTGSASQPSFDLVTRDFANLSVYSLYNIYPAFGDLDGDGDKDMVIGTSDGYLDYFDNTAGAGNPANYVLTVAHINASSGSAINIGTFAAPTLVDLNRDGKLDLVIGEKLGNLNYYENTGTAASPVFTFVTTSLGGVSVVKTAEDLYGYSSPFFYDSLGVYKLYVGSLSGYVYKYDNIENNLSGTFNLVDSMYFYEPVHSSIAGTDINNDGRMDFLVGNYSGGVDWYSNTTTSVNELSSVTDFFKLSPNPAKESLYIQFYDGIQQKNHKIIITDVLGKTLFSKNVGADAATVDVSRWTNGMYICEVIENGRVAKKKFVIRH